MLLKNIRYTSEACLRILSASPWSQGHEEHPHSILQGLKLSAARCRCGSAHQARDRGRSGAGRRRPGRVHGVGRRGDGGEEGPARFSIGPRRAGGGAAGAGDRQPVWHHPDQLLGAWRPHVKTGCRPQTTAAATATAGSDRSQTHVLLADRVTKTGRMHLAPALLLRSAVIAVAFRRCGLCQKSVTNHYRLFARRC